MPRPRAKPTDPAIKAAALETARQCLARLTIDVTSWNEQGMGPTDGPENRRKHAAAFVRNALRPGAPASIRRIASNVALPIITQEAADGRTDPNARRDDILIYAVQRVCDQHDLKPTRRSEAESGCSIVAEALSGFLKELRKYPDELLATFPDNDEYRERRRWADTELRKLPEKLFPEGALSEERLNNIWGERPH